MVPKNDRALATAERWQPGGEDVRNVLRIGGRDRGAFVGLSATCLAE